MTSRKWRVAVSRSVAERRSAILAALHTNGPQKVRALAEQFEVSAVTLRRDVEELAAREQLLRRHGMVHPAQADKSGNRKTATIGMVVPDGDHYYLDIIAGAKQACAESGARLVLGVSTYDQDTELAQVRRLVAGGVDGLVIAPTPSPETGRLTLGQEVWLSRLTAPTVLIERSASPLGPAAFLDSVTSPHWRGAAAAMRHLFELGHQHVAALMINGPNSPAIRAGFEESAAELGLRSGGVMMEGRSGSDDASAALLAAVAAGATALLIHNDRLATRALGWLQDTGLLVPEDVSIVGYDDVFAALSSVPLTAVAPFRSEVGLRALRLLLDRIFDGKAAPSPTEHVSLVPQLIVRESTAPPR